MTTIASIVFSLVIFAGNNGGITTTTIGDFQTQALCEESKKSVEEQFRHSTFRATVLCVAIPAFTMTN
ncbi:hypothetical protein UFOVP1292_43 [uncultured Caudovirales phage]|jgi:hypothetical protein|uniref:Uncharacterized protein n=1 Tax=uncultured Caudovirales phage TaxID=2100421 RepID=A0A6J5PFE2_9CAUD|nr:hypothetical protein UFOVP859_52 [uncultured Caudovirales phage]CAB4168524.1 hypothetical protein UFOVP882_50 [uncultured Caudovirales phage]CAB4196439.1 hypothetical protein UFOVP1292_43 [uncultured Caudovirales phage]CAB4205166.1 hypothetical protein UFOVP1411_34 [uncultured Caudovirales phage]